MLQNAIVSDPYNTPGVLFRNIEAARIDSATDA